MNLKIITSTTRPSRKGILVANWITEFAKKTNQFDVELLDLAKINLPLMDEPNHPRMQKYQHEHTKKWSKSIDSGDAFIIVLAEYNYAFPAPIKNAIDYLYKEWKYKPVGFVSYGGVSGGLRSSQMLKQVVTTLNMMPLSEQVILPSFTDLIDDQGVFQANEIVTKSADTMLNELEKWAKTMRGLRE